MAINLHVTPSRLNEVNRSRQGALHRGSFDTNGLPFVSAGEYLIEGEVYLDFADPARGPFRAMQWQCAGTKNRYVAASRLPAARWDLLVRMTAYTGLAASTMWSLPASDLRN